MENNKGENKAKTIMTAIELLELKCNQLAEVANLTDAVEHKLARTDDMTLKKTTEIMGEHDLNARNIVELLYDIADTMDTQINKIGNNTSRTLAFID